MCVGMGENNCAWNRHHTIHRETLAAAAAIYKGIINSLLLLLLLQRAYNSGKPGKLKEF